MKEILEFDDLDALNVMFHHFGGKMNSIDAWSADISRRRLRDLEKRGYCWKRWIGWQITKKGQEALKDNNIHSLSDTRDV